MMLFSTQTRQNRHGKMCDPGLRKYLRVEEDLIKYVEYSFEQAH